ncbi:MAG: hypothetical protein RL277_2693, partial [Planctomycetota bacterium]
MPILVLSGPPLYAPMASEQENIPPTATPQTALHPEDEIIHVPEGKSRARWIMLILLLILTLTTFTVGD